MNKPLFSLVHATRRIPQFREAFEVWSERCDDRSRVQYILAVDAVDWHQIRPVPHKWGEFRYVINRGRQSAVDAWNTAAAHSTGDILITVADDYFPPEHWDTEIGAVICAHFDEILRETDYHEFVLDVDNQDGSEPLLPFSFLSRAYYQRLGYLFWPEYIGLGADNDFTEVARRDNVVIDARHLKFEHRHPHNGFGIWDSTYEWQQRPEAVEAQYRVFDRRKAEGFPALPEKLKAEYYCHRLIVPAPGVGVAA